MFFSDKSPFSSSSLSICFFFLSFWSDFLIFAISNVDTLLPFLNISIESLSITRWLERLVPILVTGSPAVPVKGAPYHIPPTLPNNLAPKFVCLTWISPSPPYLELGKLSVLDIFGLLEVFQPII